MTGRWWGAPGISVMLHAALLLVLICAAGQPPSVDATAAIVWRRTKFIDTVRPGAAIGAGGGSRVAATPRRAQVPDSRPLDPIAPRTIVDAEPLSVTAVPTNAMQNVDLVFGAPTSVDGTTDGKGAGRGGGGGDGPGIGPGDGPGVGDVYEPGVGGVSDPKLVHEVKPNFTGDAMRAKIQGVVIMDVVVRADGSVDPARIRITRSLDRGLDQQAVIAVLQWRFNPSVRLGQAVASRVTIEVFFTLR